MSTPDVDPRVHKISKEIETAFVGLVEKIESGAGILRVEQDLLMTVLDVGRQLLQLAVEAAGDGDLGEALGEHVKHAVEPRRLRSVFGDIELRRWRYVATDGTCRYPLDASPGDTPRHTQWPPLVASVSLATAANIRVRCKYFQFHGQLAAVNDPLFLRLLLNVCTGKPPNRVSSTPSARPRNATVSKFR